MGVVAGIIALVVLAVLVVGLFLGHRERVELRARHAELDQRLEGYEARLSQVIERDRPS